MKNKFCLACTFAHRMSKVKTTYSGFAKGGVFHLNKPLNAEESVRKVLVKKHPPGQSESVLQDPPGRVSVTQVSEEQSWPSG